MRLSRIMLYGGSIGAIAAWAYLASEGMISAAGLIVALFDLLVVSGLLLALLTEGLDKQTWASVGASVRTVRHRRSVRELCGVCARFIVDTGTAKVCPSCDQIPATVTP